MLLKYILDGTEGGNETLEQRVTHDAPLGFYIGRETRGNAS